jgi:hypothetical protein
MSGRPLLFDQVRGQVERLIPLFGLHRQTSAILSLFDTLCAESLDMEVQDRVPEFSRINADGTPFQVSLSLSRRGPVGFQFLSEAGRPAYSAEGRSKASFALLNQLAGECAVLAQLESLFPTLCRLVPLRPLDLQASSAGVLWLALGFVPDFAPTLTIYANGRWGAECKRWQRLEEVAAYFGSSERWRSIASHATPRLSPLGVAFTLSSGRPTTGRIYLQAFGEPLDVYRGLFLRSNAAPGAAEAFEQFSRSMLRDNLGYPTRSAVFSVELPASLMTGAKFELCAHCAFKDDAEAATRIFGWLRQLGADYDCYDAAVSQLGLRRGLGSHSPPALHAYVGLGTRNCGPYASVYLNPGPILELESA